MTELIWFVAGLAACIGITKLFQSLRDKSPLRDTLKRFFGKDVAELPIVRRTFSAIDLANLQLAIEHYVASSGAGSRTIGYASTTGPFQTDLRSLLGKSYCAAHVTAPQYREIDIDVGQQMRCLENGLHLIDSPNGKLAVHVRTEIRTQGLEMEVMASSPELATQFGESIRERIATANILRGKVISIECPSDMPGRPGQSFVRYHRFPEVSRADIVLPDETLNLLERNTTRFFEHADVLRQGGRSLKRGLLLHGKPGTGKTYTAKWLARSLKGVTTILISGDQLGQVKECCQIARMLAPALVIMEDVDLIATERDEKRHPAYQVTLHQLMNEMDGLSSNTEVLFLLTTNRPDAIEPAIAARPGRVDQAIEFPLPDATCRRRLFELYGRGLQLGLKDLDTLVDRTEGASPAFIQELVRKAALIAAENGSQQNGKLHLTDGSFDTALREMVCGGGELTRSLLGFDQSSQT